MVPKYIEKCYKNAILVKKLHKLFSNPPLNYEMGEKF